MEASSIATSLSGDRLLLFPSSSRASFVSTSQFSRLPLNRLCIGGAFGINGYRGVALSRRDSVVSARRFAPVCAIHSDSDLPYGNQKGSLGLKKRKEYVEWDSWTAKFSGGANIPFLMLQLPQIILNAKNLSAGNNTALAAVPWLGMLTGLLGNLSLLSYFATKRETEAAVVQTLGVVSTFIVLAQLTMAEAMPKQYFVATSAIVTIGLILNCLYYFDKLSKNVWQLWEDFITLGGLSVLPQIMWSTFVPLVPSSVLPGTIAFVIALVAIVMSRTGKLSEKGVKFVGSLSGWTATLLFMWMPVSQMWTNYLNPDNIKGLSSITMLLSMMGNGLMIPRALFIRDLMWLTGSLWATVFYGYGNILCLYMVNSTSKSFFLAATIGLISWIGLTLWKDSEAYGHNSVFRSVKEVVFGP